MLEHTPLIATLVGGIVLAFIFGTIANKLRMPPLIGYLLAGIAVGPYTPGFVANAGLAHELSEIGVILLMFGVGLHFSLKDLIKVKSIALPGAILQIGIATALGMAMSAAIGWKTGEGILFGLALSCASTVVLLAALQEHRLVDTIRGQIAIGWLVVEDVIMVLALVLIPALSNLLGGSGEPMATSQILFTLGMTIMKVVAFVIVMLLVGKRTIPWLLEKIAATGSRELFGLCVLAIALGCALGSSYLFGVSFALGAFFAGMMLAESELSHRAAEESMPLRDVFSVLFFVSVGMLFDPSILIREPWLVLGTVLIIVVGKSLVSLALVLAFGRPLNTALTISASLAQIGEFSFILATLGISLGILSPTSRDLILAGAILSIIINPFLFLGLNRFNTYLENKEGAKKEPLTDNADKCARQQGHTIVVGFGELGQLVAEQLSSAKQAFVLIEDRPDIIHDPHQFPAVYGHASAPGVLEEAKIHDASHLVVTLGDPIVAGQLVELAKQLNPNIRIAVRANSGEEAEHLASYGADHVVWGKQEVARSLVSVAR